jgi:N-formylmaleamate deformylase
MKYQEGTVDVNGLKIHYYRTGGDLPPVVLNHGALDDGRCWPRLVQALEMHYDLVLPDARGHGLSDSGAGEYSSQARAGDLIGLIETLGLEKPVIGGHSMGADTSLCAAVNRPDLIAGFFMEDPPFTLPGEPLFGGPAGQVSSKRVNRTLQFVNAVPKFISIPLAKRLMPSATPAVIESWLASKQLVSEDFIQVLGDPQWLAGCLEDELLNTVSSPALLIYGDREKGAIVSKAAAERAAERIEGLRVVLLEGATHDIRRTQFEGYLAAVQDFLKRVWE